MHWIILSILSASLVTLRHLYIKKFCRDIASELLIFYTRLTGAFIYIGMLSIYTIHIQSSKTFFPILMLTVGLTAIATIMQIREIQRSNLNQTLPYLTFIPIFMIPWAWIVYRQIPSIGGFIGILVTCVGAYVLNMRKERSVIEPILHPFRQRHSRIMLGVALLLSITTTSDKLAIDAASAFTYALIWTCTSAVVMWFIVIRMHGLQLKFEKHALIQAVFWAGAFLCQMLAVQQAHDISSGVTYVKLLTMMNILFSVAVGGHVFREANYKRSLVASGLMVIGVGVVALSAN